MPARELLTNTAMIRVIVELVPDGDESRVQQIGSMEIVNDETSTSLSLGNYDVEVKTLSPVRPVFVVDRVRVTNHNRLQPVWPLVKACLEKL